MKRHATIWRKYETMDYGCLIVLRIAFAFLGMGYIHPDEYFQNAEITAGAILGLRTVKTWEWDTAFPCRSISAPLLSTGIPFMILKFIFKGDVPPIYIFAAERLSLLLLSFALDYSTYRLVPYGSRQALILLASSSTLLTFQLRPFSNSLEAIILALSLIAYKRMHDQPTKTIHLSCLAILMVIGTFTRITFLAFAAPLAFGVLLHLWRRSALSGLLSCLSYLIFPALVALVATVTLVVLDSRFFYGSLERVVFTPYNLLLYNLSSENLAKHGLHPRWLHVTANLPMIISPPLLLCGVKACWEVLRLSSVVKKRTEPSSSRALHLTCVYMIVTSLALLSLQPHQEPRFLTPLLVPFIILVANGGFISRAGKWFWVTTLAFNVVLSLVFGVLHQGGVIRSLLSLHDLINSQVAVNGNAIVYWKTYMPPRHLLAIPERNIERQTLSLTDLAGSSQDELKATLLSLATTENIVVYLVTPPFAMQSLDPNLKLCLSAESLLFPHLDLDHIPESVAMGWRDGLSLGVYSSSSSCLRFQPSSVL